MTMIMMLNLKGGVAKTTNAVAIAEYLASMKKRILFIDADHQYTASELLIGEERCLEQDAKRKTLHDLLSSMMSEDFESSILEKYIAGDASNISRIRKYIDCIPCSYRIDEFTSNIAKAKKGYLGDEEFQKKWLNQKRKLHRWCLKNYDFTIVDCPPSLAIQVRFFLGCADFFIAPTIPDRLSVRGTAYLLERIRKRGHKRILPLGSLWSMVRVQNRKHKEMMKIIEDGKCQYDGIPKPFQTYIPNMAAISNAMENNKEFVKFNDKYKSQSTKLYKSLCQEIIQRIEKD